MNATHEIQLLIDAGALFVANHSGGKDSQIQLIQMLQLIPANQIVVIHASLGNAEWPGALELAEKQADDAGLPFIVAKAGKTIFDMVRNRKKTRPEVPSWPSTAHRQCTSDLKRGPIQREVRRYAKANGFEVIVNCLGLRAEESPPRAKRSTFKKMSISNSVATWYEWLPIHDLKTHEVFAGIKQAGQDPHYAYALGNQRLSCVFCIMGSPNDIQNGAKHHPELLNEYVQLEDDTGYYMHASRIPLIELSTPVESQPQQLDLIA